MLLLKCPFFVFRKLANKPDFLFGKLFHMFERCKLLINKKKIVCFGKLFNTVCFCGRIIWTIDKLFLNLQT